MRLNKIEGEVLQKRVTILIPQIKKSETVNHFQIEGYPAEIRLKCKKTTIKTRVSSKNVFLTFVQAGFSCIIVRGCRFGKLNK